MKYTYQRILIILINLIIFANCQEGECEKGKWGDDCNNNCEPKCNVDKGNCDKTTGKCPYCIDGCYSKENKCEDCPGKCLLTCTADGCHDCKEGDSYGIWCTDTCKNCQTVQDNPRKCEKVDGNCLGECNSGFYGPKCERSCSPNCNLSKSNCDKQTGNCEQCNDGYYGPNCEKCPDLCLLCESNTKCFKCKEKDSYGILCDQKCSAECAQSSSANELCELETGNCYKCIEKKYGPKCQETCLDPNCQECNQETGECLKCLDGFYLNDRKCSKCASQCTTCLDAETCLGCVDNNKYGKECQEVCSEFCDYEPDARHCDFTTGNCSKCKTNCKGDKCELCEDGFSGKDCSDKCKEGCDITQGNCDKTMNCNHCLPLYFGLLCEYKVDIPNCTSCDEQGKCLSCDKEFYLDEGRCKDCPLTCKDKDCTKEGCKECIEGYYGTMCGKQCSPNCKNKSCSRQDGKCDCKENFIGDKCDKCIQGKTGKDCIDNCNENCDLDDGTNCEKEDGSCLKCKAGYHGKQCQIPCNKNCLKEGAICDKNTGKCLKCIEEFYDAECDKSCPLPNCKECNKESGQCEKCKETFYDITKCEKCPKECKDFKCDDQLGCYECSDPKTYGKLCEKTCPANCDYTIEPPYCQDPDGKCKKCRQNFEGNQCQNCIKGKYSTDCSLDCSSGCKNEECNKEDGKCSPCKTKLWGDKCENDCPSECNTEAMNCDKSNGGCQICNYGYYTEKCIACPDNCGLICDHESGDCKECKDKHWGPKCEEKCSENCQQTCAKETGHCDSCNSGYYGNQCKENCFGCATSCTKNQGECMNHLCKENYYLPWDCSKTCSEDCIGKQCDLFTGECKVCPQKKWGPKCQYNWEADCAQDTRVECNSAVTNHYPSFKIALVEQNGLKDSYPLLSLKIGSTKQSIVVLIDFDSNSPLVVFDKDKNLHLDEQSKSLKAVYSSEKSETDKHAEKLLKNANYDLFDTLEGDYFTEDIYINIKRSESNMVEEVKINVHFLNPSIVTLKKDGTKITKDINGIIGLGFLSSFGQDLVYSKLILKNIFIHSQSSLIFGDYTREIKKDFIQLTTLIPKEKCEFNSKKIIKTTVKGFTSNFGKGYQLSIEAIVSYSQKTELAFPTTLQSYFEKLYFASFFEHGCYLKELSKNIKEYTCESKEIFSNLPLLGLVIDDYIYYLNENDLFESENNRYRFKIQLKKEPKIVLGKEFLNRFSVIYNQGNSTLNFYGNHGDTKKLLINLVEIPKEWPDIANNGWFTPGTYALLAIFGSLAVFTVGYIVYHCYKRKAKEIRAEPLYDPNS